MMTASGVIKREKILILAKTYPTPSAKYGETTCVAGITENGEMRRLYPIPFRMLESDSLFKKWQWIDVETYINTGDKRPESRKISFEKIETLDSIATDGKWKRRRSWLDNVPKITHFLPNAFVTPSLPDGISLGIFTPQLPVKLEITKAKKLEWDENDLRKLKKVEEAYEKAHFLMEPTTCYKQKPLEIIPYDFHYRTKVQTSDGGEKEIRVKLIDWEVCSLYRNCKKIYGEDWQKPFINKIETEMNSKDLKILMGNQHRFSYEWLGISIIYPPKQTLSETAQRSLFDEIA